MDGVRVTIGPTAKDALTELATVSCGNAAGALSRLIGGRRVMIDVPHAEVAPADRVAEMMGDPSGPAVAVTIQIGGDLDGEFLLIQREPDARRLSAALLGQDDLASELVRSALCEAGNIVACTCFTAISRFVGLDLMPSVPRFAEAAACDLVAGAAARAGKGGKALVLETRFAAGGEGSFSGHFVLFPAAPSVTRMIGALEKAAPEPRA